MGEAQFEKVVKGLECFVNHVNGPYRDDCRKAECDYLKAGDCEMMVMSDALALIRQQQERIAELEAGQTARVMTLEELDAIYQTKELHTWPFNTPPYLWMTVNPDIRQIRGFWICWRDIKYSLENDSPFYVRENYGKVWKIWTAEPTDEQREAVPWDG